MRRNSSRPKRPAYAFIDSQNLNLGIQKLGWKMDWQKFRKFLAEKHNIDKAYMFIGYVPENEDMYQQLHDAGYLIVLKPTFDMTNEKLRDRIFNSEKTVSEKSQSQLEKANDSGESESDNNETAAQQKPVKGNIDADLVVWAMKEIPNYSRAVVVSGDGDFFALYEYLHSINKLGNIMVPNRSYSQLLNQYDKYIVRLDAMKRQLAYVQYRKRRQN